MAFLLRYGQRDYPLDQEEFLIGRSMSCQLPLDDPLVSRNHAALRVAAGAVVIEDLGSRNGVKVNGDRIAGKRDLSHGDRVNIGKQEMVFVIRSNKKDDTLTQGPQTRRFASFDILGELAEKAIVLGRADEAERLVGKPLAQFLAQVKEGLDPSAALIGQAADYAVKLASITKKSEWTNYVFELHASTGTLCAAGVVDALYEVLPRVKVLDLGPLREYLEQMRRKGSRFGPNERFLLSRLEGLSRVAG
jgi:hypothetical protein